MALDLDAIRKKVAQLSGNGNRSTSRVNMWKPATPKTGETPKEYKIRALPWKNPPEGQPFLERWFYYIGDGPGILTLHQFGKPDPINELINKLYRSGKPEDKALAKKLLPKMRAYAPVIVRGEEAEGVKVWSFGKMVYQRLLGFFIDAEVGDILDVKDGFDLKITFKKQGSKDFCDTEVDAARRASPLADDTQAKAWLDAVPSLDDMYRLKTYQELEDVLNRWLNAGGSTDDGAPRGEAGMDAGTNEKLSELDKVVAEVTASDAEKTEGKAKKPKKEKPADEFKSLDEAFADLSS